jgi:ribonuclease VapC
LIIDTSALLAVIFNEEDEERMLTMMVDAPAARICAANWVEAAIIIDGRRNSAAMVRFDDVTAELRLEIVAVSTEIAYGARRAYANYGKGHHAARLNFGDCFAYALAKEYREPLLFKGNDFAQTDIEPALKR